MPTKEEKKAQMVKFAARLRRLADEIESGAVELLEAHEEAGISETSANGVFLEYAYTGANTIEIRYQRKD